jgi:hypothetical protein
MQKTELNDLFPGSTPRQTDLVSEYADTLAASRTPQPEDQGNEQNFKTGIAARVMTSWEAAKDARNKVTQRMLSCMRRRSGEYEPDKLAKINERGGSTIFMMITDEKCAAAEAWLEDFLLPADDKPWGVKPTPVPELSPDIIDAVHSQVQREFFAFAQQEIQQAVAATGVPVTSPEAAMGLMRMVMAHVQESLSLRHGELLEMEHAKLRQEAKRQDAYIESKIEDKLAESGWRAALKEHIADLSTFPAAFIKGPVLRREPQLEWVGGEIEVVEKIVVNFERVSPFDIWPSPSSTSIDDGYLIETHRLTRRDLHALIGVSGYDEEAIRLVLVESKGGGLKDWTLGSDETTRKVLEGRDMDAQDPDGKIEALQFWGSVPGSDLLEYGIDPLEIDDPDKDYDAEVWLIGRHVIKAKINGDRLGRKPYYKASWRNVAGSFWGIALPEILKDTQDSCNAAARNLINHMGIASGPQVWVDISLLPQGSKVTNMYPWKIWQGDMRNAQPGRIPIQFFQPNDMTASLLRVYEFFSAEADKKSVPSYAYGSRGSAEGGPLGTASGYSMMTTAASRGIKKVVGNIDIGVVEPSVERTFWHLLEYESDEKYRGDVKIIARGSSALAVREQQAIRQNEFLQVAANNPNILAVIGQQGLAVILRDILKTLGFDVDDIVPHKMEMQGSSFQPQTMLPGGPLALPPGQGGPLAGAQYAQGQQTNFDGSMPAGGDFALFGGGAA